MGLLVCYSFCNDSCLHCLFYLVQLIPCCRFITQKLVIAVLASQEIRSGEDKPKVNHRVYRSLQLADVLSPMAQVTSLRVVSLRPPSSAYLGLPRRPTLSRFPIKFLCAFVNYSMWATSPALLILLHFVTVIIIGEMEKLLKPLSMKLSPASCYSCSGPIAGPER